MSGRTHPSLIIRITLHVAVYAGALTMVLPVAWIVSTSLKSHHDAISALPTLLPAGPPSEWQWHNYAQAWTIAQFGDFYRNSLLVAAVVTVLSVAYNALAGFAFAKMRFRGRNIAFGMMLATMLLPFQASTKKLGYPAYSIFLVVGVTLGWDLDRKIFLWPITPIF